MRDGEVLARGMITKYIEQEFILKRDRFHADILLGSKIILT